MGLSPLQNDKVSTILNRKKESIEKLDGNGLRIYPEQQIQNMNVGDIVVTVEYSVNCGQSGISTRHDYEKYEGIAQNIKKSIERHFPIIRTFLKPNLFDGKSKDNIETAFARSRLGVCDVQIVRKTGESTRDAKVLHSKLQTQTWPNLRLILDKIREYMPTVDIVLKILREG